MKATIIESSADMHDRVQITTCFGGAGLVMRVEEGRNTAAIILSLLEVKALRKALRLHAEDSVGKVRRDGSP